MPRRAARRGSDRVRSKAFRLSRPPELLEARRLLATFTVTSTADTPTGGTLRQSLAQAAADTNPDVDSIAFAIPGSGVQRIVLTSPLPTIASAVTIDGRTQGPAPTPLIFLDGGGLADRTANGLTFGGGSANSTLQGLAIGGFGGAGVAILGSGDVGVQGNFLGVDPTNASASPNGVGVSIRESASNSVGGLAETSRNIISGNTGAGVEIRGAGSRSNAILGNTIGLASNGVAVLPNGGSGVLLGGFSTGISGAGGNSIGGTSAAARNLISGNRGAGVELLDQGTAGNLIQGNLIGTTIAGDTAAANAVGVIVGAGASANTIGGTTVSTRNVISGNTAANIVVRDSFDNLIGANFVGTTLDGLTGLGGAGTAGILVSGDASGNQIGGATTGIANIISGNVGPAVWVRGPLDGIGKAPAGTLVRGNRIGTDPDGRVAIPNGLGVVVSLGATSTTVGGASGVSQNIISGNRGDGIRLAGFNTDATAIQGNIIGADLDDNPLPNGGAGIFLDGASQSTIGGTAAGLGNTISGNAGAGVRIVAGIDNAIRRNTITANGGLGIDLGPLGPTPNDPLDPDEGANRLQNTPTIDRVLINSPAESIVSGSLRSLPNTSFIVEFYGDNTPDASGFGEGRTFLGSTTVMTGADGSGDFSTSLTTPVAVGDFVTATATDPFGNTSEFAANRVGSGPVSNLQVTQSIARPGGGSSGSAVAGSTVTYSVVVGNLGPDATSTVGLLDDLPSGFMPVSASTSQGTVTVNNGRVTANFGAIPNGSTASLTIVGNISAGANAPESLVNTASIVPDPTTTDPDPSNNSSTLVTPVVQGSDLVVDQTASPNPANVGDLLAFSITVTNAGETLANGVVLTETLPENFEFTSAVANFGVVGGSNGQVNLAIGDLPAGGTVTLTVFGRPTAAATLTSTAFANADQSVADPSTATSTFNVQASAIVLNPGPLVGSVVRLGRGAQPPRIVLGFDSDLAIATASNFANYRLTAPGRDGVLGTADDRNILIRAASYDPANRFVTLFVLQPYSFALPVRLTVSATTVGGVTGTSGALLDGDYDGQAGGDFVADLQGAYPIAINPTAVDALMDGGLRARRTR